MNIGMNTEDKITLETRQITEYVVGPYTFSESERPQALRIVEAMNDPNMQVCQSCSGKGKSWQSVTKSEFDPYGVGGPYVTAHTELKTCTNCNGHGVLEKVVTFKPISKHS
jgi:hypothetical protein